MLAKTNLQQSCRASAIAIAQPLRCCEKWTRKCGRLGNLHKTRGKQRHECLAHKHEAHECQQVRSLA